MGSALLNPAAHASADVATISSTPETPDELRRQVAARLAAHRERRLRSDAPRHDPVHASVSPHDGQKSRIAAAVAERYSKAQSYRAFLADEAERAVQQARAAAEIAARNAKAVSEVQQRLLRDLALQARAESQANPAPPVDPAPIHEFQTEQALWPDLDKPVEPVEPVESIAPAKQRIDSEATRQRSARPNPAPADSAFAAHSAEVPALRVVLYDDTPAASLSHSAVPPPLRPRRDRLDDPEALALDEEISFRQAPVFEEPAGPPMALPANLIEFPRQLIAARKARPRYAEGPLRDEDSSASGKEQLRIFEVLPAQISTQPELAEPAQAPEPQWTSLWLDTVHAYAHSESAPQVEDAPAPASSVFTPPKLYTANFSRRLLAGSVDMAITALAGLGCAAAFAGTTGLIAGQATWQVATLRAVAAEVVHTVPVSSLALNGVVALLFLSIALQAIFFTFSEATPGMRIARIALCTFSDDNPTRAAMRRRIPALVLSTALLGFGFWWALLDQDRLTWHDLISRMYQRSY